MKFRSLAITLLACCMQSLSCRAQFVLKDTLTVIELNTRAFTVRVNDLELSRELAAKAAKIARALGYQRGLSFSYSIFGNYHRSHGNYDSSLYYYKESLRIRTRLRDTLNMARSFRNVMKSEDDLGQHEKAMQTGRMALRLLAAVKPGADVLKEKAWLLTSLGFFYFNAGIMDTAVQLTYAAKELFSGLNDQEGVTAVGMNLGTIYEQQKKYDRAISEYNACIPVLRESGNLEELAKALNNTGNVLYRMAKYRQALTYYLQAKTIRDQNGFDGDAQGSMLNLAVIYESLGKGDSATLYYEKALKASIESGNRDVQYESHRALGTYLITQKDYRSGIGHLLKAMQLLENARASVETNQLFNELAKAYSMAGRYDSALFYTNQYNLKNDSLNERLRRSIVYETDLKEAEQQLGYQEVKNKLQGTIISIMVVILVLVIIIFFLYYRFARSKKNMHELRELVKDKELKALDAMLEGQQEERKRLATELHDTIGSMLSATKFSFKVMEKSMEKIVEENKSQYQKINSMLDETMDSVRRISHNMASGIFAEKGMEGALSELCATFEQAGKMRIHLNVYGFDQSVEYHTEINLYRMVQELLSNIIKHANAREVSIQLIKSDGNINLTVEDDGIGFNPVESRKKKGMGLSNIDLRVTRLSGQWNIDSGKGNGTIVIIDIPLNKEED